MKIGEILRTERESKGLSLADIEKETKIRAKYIQALEEENYDEIPGAAYCMGFLRNYARFLEIDPDPLVYQFRSQVEKTNQSLPSVPIDVEQTEKKSQPKSVPFRLSTKKVKAFFGFAVFVVFIFSIAFVFFSNMERDTPPSETPPSKPPISQEQEIDKQKAAPPAEEKITMQLVGNQRCWTRVTVDGNVEFEGNLNSGETKDFEAKDSIQLRLGNAGGVDVIYNGKKESPLGNPGQVVEKEYLRTS